MSISIKLFFQSTITKTHMSSQWTGLSHISESFSVYPIYRNILIIFFWIHNKPLHHMNMIFPYIIKSHYSLTKKVEHFNMYINHQPTIPYNLVRFEENQLRLTGVKTKQAICLWKTGKKPELKKYTNPIKWF